VIHFSGFIRDLPQERARSSSVFGAIADTFRCDRDRKWCCDPSEDCKDNAKTTPPSADQSKNLPKLYQPNGDPHDFFTNGGESGSYDGFKAEKHLLGVGAGIITRVKRWSFPPHFFYKRRNCYFLTRCADFAIVSRFAPIQN